MLLKCKLCGSQTHIIHHVKFGDYHHCNTCQFISKDEQNMISTEDELGIYNSHNNSIEDLSYVDYFNTFLGSAVFPFVNEGTQGFDFGSGPSPVLSEILSRDYGYTMDIYDLFYSSEKVYLGKKYDLITSTEVVEHLSDPISYFMLFRSLMKPDSILAIMTQFHQNDDAQFKTWHYMRDRSHISFYTPKTFEIIAQMTGLQIIYTNNKQYITFIAVN